MPTRADTDALLLYDPSRARSTVNVWVARPSGPEDLAHGKLFLISAIDSAAHVNHEIIDIIQEELRVAFYRPEILTIERRFEEALQAVNRRLHALIADGVNEWVTRCHFLIGVTQGSHLILAPVRSVHAYLLRGTRLHDILGIGDTEAPNPLRIFSQVVGGQVEQNDRLLFCLPSLLDYFSLEKLRRTILDHAPAAAVRSFEQALIDVDPSVSFAALIVRVRSEQELPVSNVPDRPVPAISRTAPQQSMDTLIRTERSTDRIMTPSVWPFIIQGLRRTGRAFRDFTRTTILGRPPKRTLVIDRPPTESPVTPTPRPDARPTLRAIGHTAKRTATATGRVIVMTVRRLGQRWRLRGTPRTPMARVSPITSLQARWGAMTTMQRRIAGVIVVAIILFTAVIARLALPSETNTNTTVAVSAVEAEIARAEAAILFGGESIANEALTKAETDIEKLPTKKKSDRTTIESLRSRITAVRAQLAKRFTLENERTVMSFAADTDLNDARMNVLGNTIITLVTTRNAVLLIDRETGEVRAADPTPDVGQLLRGVVVGQAIVYVTDRPGFVELNPQTGTWRALDSSFPGTKPTIAGLAAYENRLYVLDREGDRVLRFTRGGTSYGTGVNWLKATTDLATASDLAVDGSVYIIFGNDRVDGYFGGRRGTFALAPLDPPLEGASALWTATNASAIYLLDQTDQRVVVFDKDGGLRRQLVHDGWSTIRSFVVDETNKVLYLLDGTRLLTYTLPG